MAEAQELKVGFTSDRRSVFLHFDCGSQDGTPLTGTLTIPPRSALELSKRLKEAAVQCDGFGGGLISPP